jgi:hypothetical protein
MNTLSSKSLIVNSNSFNSNSQPSGRLLSSNLSQIIENSKSKINDTKIENEIDKNIVNDQSISNFK